MADGVSIRAQKRKIGKRPSHLVRDGGTKHLHRDVLPVVWRQEEGKHVESVELRFCTYLKIQRNIEGSVYVCPKQSFPKRMDGRLLRVFKFASSVLISVFGPLRFCVDVCIGV